MGLLNALGAGWMPSGILSPPPQPGDPTETGSYPGGYDADYSYPPFTGDPVPYGRRKWYRGAWYVTVQDGFWQPDGISREGQGRHFIAAEADGDRGVVMSWFNNEGRLDPFNAAWFYWDYTPWTGGPVPCTTLYAELRRLSGERYQARAQSSIPDLQRRPDGRVVLAADDNGDLRWSRNNIHWTRDVFTIHDLPLNEVMLMKVVIGIRLDGYLELELDEEQLGFLLPSSTTPLAPTNIRLQTVVEDAAYAYLELGGQVINDRTCRRQPDRQRSTYAIIHHTGGRDGTTGSAAAVAAWQNRQDEVSASGYHVLIDEGTTLYCCNDDTHRAYGSLGGNDGFQLAFACDGDWNTMPTARAHAMIDRAIAVLDERGIDRRTIDLTSLDRGRSNGIDYLRVPAGTLGVTGHGDIQGNRSDPDLTAPLWGRLLGS